MTEEEREISCSNNAMLHVMLTAPSWRPHIYLHMYLIYHGDHAYAYICTLSIMESTASVHVLPMKAATARCTTCKQQCRKMYEREKKGKNTLY